MKKYGTIVADPPWEYDAFPYLLKGEEKSSKKIEMPYSGMSIEEICALPVHRLAQKACALWLWTTNRWMPQAFDVVRAWGFDYRQTITWKKTNAQPAAACIAPNSEFLLICRKGPLKWKDGWEMWPSSVVEAPRAEHSRKPEVFLDLIEATSPGPYIEMFSRRARMGWDTWGNQALGEFDIDLTPDPDVPDIKPEWGPKPEHEPVEPIPVDAEQTELEWR